MATNFPGSQDNFTNPTSTSSLSSPSHSQQHSDVNDAVEAIELALLDGAPLHIDDANERIGIGTNNPERLVDIRGASNPEIRFQSTDSTDPFIYFGDQVDAVRAGIGYDVSANELLLRGYNNNNRLTIDSSGNVDVTTGDLSIGGTAVGKWTSFTPSWSGLTVGSGTETWLYCVVNELMVVTGRTVFAADSSVDSTTVTMTIPGSYSIAFQNQWCGGVQYTESGASTYEGFIDTQSTTSVRFREYNVSGSNIIRANISSTSPFTWGTSSAIKGTFTVRIT